MELKLDNSVVRENDRGTRNDPEKPLTPEQKEYLRKKLGKKCILAYVNRFKKSGLESDWEDPRDLANDAWVFFENILGKFDLKKYDGKISKTYDVEGEGKPKTLEFYFKNYFYNRINFTAQESRTDKKERGIGPVEHMSEIIYDPEDNSQSLSEHHHKYEITGDILAEVKKKDKEFQRFFQQKFIDQCTDKELRDEYKDKFKIYKSLVEDMIKRYAAKYNLEFNKNNSSKD